LLIELFDNKKNFSKYKYTLSEYVIGMKDKDLEMNQDQNDEVN